MAAKQQQQPSAEEDDAVATKRRSNRPHYDPAKNAPTSQRQPVAAAATAPPPIRGPPYEQERLLTKKQVLARVGVSFPTLWGWMQQEKFPRSRAVGSKSMWLESELNAWIAGLPIRRLKGDEEAA